MLLNIKHSSPWVVDVESAMFKTRLRGCSLHDKSKNKQHHCDWSEFSAPADCPWSKSWSCLQEGSISVLSQVLPCHLVLMYRVTAVLEHIL